MLPEWSVKCHPDGVTSKEFARLLAVRLETLEAATAHTSLPDHLPIQWRKGWKATLEILGRDRDGSLRARVVCTSRELSEPYVRRVRLVKRQGLTLGRRLE